MKKIIIAIMAMTVAVSAFAGRPTGLILGGGAVMDTYKAGTVYNYHYTDQASFYGSYLEVGYDLKVEKNIDLLLSARYTTTFRWDEPIPSTIVSRSDYTSVSDFSVRSYLEIPFKFQFSWNISPAVKIFLALGPTYNFWISNETTHLAYKNVGNVEEKELTKHDWFKEESSLYLRHNVALGGDFGFIVHKVKIFAGYDHNMLNFVDKAYYRSSGKNSYLRIGANYTF